MGLVLHLFQNFFGSGNHSFHRAIAAVIDKRVKAVEEKVAAMIDIRGILQVNGGVSIGMCRRQVAIAKDLIPVTEFSAGLRTSSRVILRPAAGEPCGQEMPYIASCSTWPGISFGQ